MTKLNSKLSKEEIDYIIQTCMNKGAGNVMREEQEALGRRVLALGDEPWLSKDDWNDDIVISVDANRVWILALIAKVPGRRSFSRMVDGILDAGLVPVVVCPFASMEEILKRWDWRGIRNEETMESQWFPQRKFKEERRRRREKQRADEMYKRAMRGDTSTSSEFFTINFNTGALSSSTITKYFPY